ncbi:hypothetical protein Misp01_46050 [Microtetraspora sp. NBRC 13810]|uniref:DUF6624 domain-containing protein n=1 Tax=Microtetraspora sp. NBRC 13810 TaxID=3030990 RepID=UPI0024A3516C|nr:DUF6624 domain-containing protein [Microtetraspora sp. NBRC 13810]GLW09476.1 hypothetical protein Misp01_46050 [Microtetraspora sp. NBRC 13810]
MRALFSLLLLALFAVSACGQDVPEAPRNPALRAELLKMAERDQAARRPGGSADAMASADRANGERMARILDEHGWPGWALVGEDGAQAAWLLIQHADLNLPLQRRGLALMQKAVDDGDADPSDLAYLVDRVRVAEGRPQVYGTQWGVSAEGEWKPNTPIENEAEVDERRADAGLKPLRDYLAELKSLPS